MREDNGRQEEPQEEPQENADPFLGALEALAESPQARIDVYRHDRVTNAQAYMGKMGVAEFDLDAVRKRWGGGKFQFRAIKGGNTYVKAKTVEIAGPYRDFSRVADEEEEEERTSRREAEANAKREALANAPVLQAVESLSADIRMLLQGMRNPPREAENANPAAMTRELMQTVQTMIQPYMEMMRDRVDSTRDRDDRDPLEYFRMGMEMARDSGGGDSDPYGSVLRNLGLPLLQQLQTAGALERLGAGNPGMMNPNPPTETTMAEPTDALGALAPWIPTLQAWAKARTNPEIRADFVVDELPSRWLDMLEEFVGEGDALTKFFTRYPATMEYRVWYERFIGGLRENFGTDEGPAPGRPEVGTGEPPGEEDEED